VNVLVLDSIYGPRPQPCPNWAVVRGLWVGLFSYKLLLIS